MKLKCTKVFAKILNTKAKENEKTKDYTITCEKLSERAYTLNVDIDAYLNETDYNTEDNTFNVIRVAYPYNYYASPRYLTTRELIKIYNNAQNKTLDGIVGEILEEIEI